jgi:dTMP kinase
MGKLIVIDGLDGSGKGTQSRLLTDYLTENGMPARRIDFPRHGKKSAALVDGYLAGELGGHPDDTGGYAAATFFGIDRYWSYRTEWGDDYKSGKIIVADRYTTANAVHQCSKMPKSEWNGFLDWLWDNEYVKLGIPKPDLIIYLEMRPDISRALIKSRAEKDGRQTDIHETDSGYLDRCYEAALYASRYLGWKKIVCYEGDSPRPITDIFEEVKAAALECIGKQETQETSENLF